MLTFKSNNLNDTIKLGQTIGLTIKNHLQQKSTLPIQAILLRGDLGSGKTSLTRALVQSLPHGMQAEVSSPSFTLCNTYQTKPEILHVDLYRCEHNIPIEVWDTLDIQEDLIIIEWAEFLPSSALPQNFLDIFFKICEQNRSIIITAHGPTAEVFLQSLT